MASRSGLVADGRDMGTVIFPDADVKVFLTASAEARAERRVTQLLNAGQTADFEAILVTIKERDDRSYPSHENQYLIISLNNTHIALEQSIYRPDLLTNSFIKLSIIKIGITVGSRYVKSSS